MYVYFWVDDSPHARELQIYNTFFLIFTCQPFPTIKLLKLFN